MGLAWPDLNESLAASLALELPLSAGRRLVAVVKDGSVLECPTLLRVEHSGQGVVFPL